VAARWHIASLHLISAVLLQIFIPTITLSMIKPVRCRIDAPRRSGHRYSAEWSPAQREAMTLPSTARYCAPTAPSITR
jgi:hypothetical protein